MELEATVACPHCGSANVLCLDAAQPHHRFTTDCEVCCRPFEVRAACEPDRVLWLEATGE